MSFSNATALLWSASIRNRILRQVRRLQQPRYLIASIVGLFYLWSVFLRRVRMASSNGFSMDPHVYPLIEAGLMGVALLLVGGAWIFGADRAQLEFSEAEIQFLFPAPVSRRALLRFKIGKSLLRLLLSALASTIFVGGMFTAHRGFFFVGAWFAFSTLGLHLTGASLTRESLTRHGRFGALRRPLTLAGVVAVVGLLAAWTLWTAKPPPPDTLDLEAVAGWLNDLTHQAPLAWVLFPIRAPLRVALAQSGPDFLAALPAAAVVLLAHAAWVVSSDVAFEEAAVEAAEARARRMERRRAGQGRTEVGARARRFRLPLSHRGRPELALVWKNVLAARRTTGPLMLMITSIVGVSALAGGFQALRSGSSGLFAVLGIACVAMAAFLTVLGPSMLRVDLRQDLPNMDILRSLPLSGAAVVRAELLGPGAVLTLLLWALLALGVGLSAGYPMEEFPVRERVSLAVAAGLVAPMFSLAGLAVQNVAVLLFPAWVVVDRTQPRGVEAVGQRLLTTAGTLVVLMVGVVPAALAGGLVLLVLWSWLGWVYAAPFAGLAAAAVIGAELYFATLLMGRLFERFDVSE